MVRRNQKSQELDQSTALEIASEFISFLKRNNYNIKQAYLFGSYVSGKFNDDSRIEPHPFDDTDFNSQHPIAGEILRTGIRVE